MAKSRVYFLGEFGHFNFTVLGKLECYLQAHQGEFEIVTYPDYYVLLEKLFPGRFVLIPYSIDTVSRDERRSGNRLGGFERLIARSGFSNLAEMLGCDGRQTIAPIARPIEEDEADVPTSEITISMCCRKRRHDKHRNLSHEQWKAIIAADTDD